MYPTKPPDNDMLRAGVKKLDKYGWIGAIDVLANGNLLKWNEVMSVSYERALTKLAMDREVKQYNERYGKILKEKAERNSKNKRP